MEDPWATGPSWASTPSKPSPPSSPPPLSPPRATFPSSSNADYDPWAPPALPTPPPVPSSPLQDDAQQAGFPDITIPIAEVHRGWEDEAMGGWGQPTPRAVPAEPADLPQPGEMSLPMSPVDEPDPGAGAWSLDSPRAEPDELDPPPEVSSTPPQLGPINVPSPRQSSPYKSGPSSPFASPSRAMQPSPAAYSPRLDLPSDPSTSTYHMPKSPSFPEDGFGGFASSAPLDAGGADPWGTGVQDDSWGSPRLSSPASPHRSRTPDESDDDEGPGWGGVRPPRGIDSPGAQGETDWDRAQVEMRIKEARAPQEKILYLRGQWEEVAKAVNGPAMPKLTEEEDQALRDRARLLDNKIDENLRSMSDIPSDINTYPPVLSSLTIHERHMYAISRPDPLPATSLLHLAPRPQRSSTAQLAAAGSDAWFGRSRLGEPEVTPVEAPVEQEEKKGWFWQRSRGPEKPLVTSGGGMLERAATPSSVTGSNAQVQGSRAASPASTAPSTRKSEDVAASAAPGPSGPIPVTTTASGIVDTAPAPAMAAGPSRTSRFWGRFGRKAPAAESTAQLDDKDLELSNADFSFLDQVPTVLAPAGNSAEPQRNVADLLFMEDDGPRPEPSAGSEFNGPSSVGASAGQASVPAPLEPPPRPSVGSRSSSGTGTGPAAPTRSRFVPRMVSSTRPPPVRKVSDMDLLGGLSFGDNEASASSAAQGASLGPARGGDWDALLSGASAQPAPGRSTPGMLTPPAIQPPSPGRATAKSHDFFAGADFGSFGPLATASGSKAPGKAQGDVVNLDDDFGDFGDFSAFGSGDTLRPKAAGLPLPSQPRPQPPTQPGLGTPFSLAPGRTTTPPLQPTPAAAPAWQSISATSAAVPVRASSASPSSPKSSGMAPSSSSSPRPLHIPLDHTPTFNLMSDVASMKGQRWPAPPSPAASPIPPPPGAQSNGFGFPIAAPSAFSGPRLSQDGAIPFLSPPPGGARLVSGSGGRRGGSLLDDEAGESPASDSKSDAASFAAAMSRPMSAALSGQSGTSNVGQRSETPFATQTGGNAKQGGGLTAQDLSFFDSL